MRDELVGLIASWDKSGREGDRQFFLEAWNGTDDYDTDRIGRGTIIIPNLCVSIFGGMQPDKLTAYLEQASDALGNNGLLQRFQLLVYPTPSNGNIAIRSPMSGRASGSILSSTGSALSMLRHGVRARSGTVSSFPTSFSMTPRKRFISRG